MSKLQFLDDLKLTHIENNVFLSSLMEINPFKFGINKIVLVELFDNDFIQQQSDLNGKIGRIFIKIYDVSENESNMKVSKIYSVMFDVEDEIDFDLQYKMRHILPYYYYDKSNDTEVMETAIQIASEIVKNGK